MVGSVVGTFEILGTVVGLLLIEGGLVGSKLTDGLELTLGESLGAKLIDG